MIPESVRAEYDIVEVKVYYHNGKKKKRVKKKKKRLNLFDDNESYKLTEQNLYC